MSEQKYIRVDEISLHYSGLETIAPNDYVGIARHFEREIRHLPTYTPTEIMAQQWVPVTERLPEDGEICLLYKAGFGIGLFQYQTDGGFFADKDAHQFDRDSGGVFWQPLPQTPKEEHNG